MRPRVDTRNKILTSAGAYGLPGPLTLVTGYFDVLRAGHARELQQARDRASDRKLLVAVITYPGELIDGQSRAELVAALRMVDYVVTANHDELDGFIERLRPAEIVRLEAADLGRRRRLIEDVQRRQHP
jgi:glycerol-3-phosphate cytidylyltransferase-like family protein